MFGDRASKLSTALFEKFGPSVGIKMLGSEHRDKVFIAKLGGMAIGFAMVVVLGCPLAVHVVGIPGYIGAGRWDRVDAPMGVDAELNILQPLRIGMLAEGVPRGLVKFAHDRFAF